MVAAGRAAAVAAGACVLGLLGLLGRVGPARGAGVRAEARAEARVAGCASLPGGATAEEMPGASSIDCGSVGNPAVAAAAARTTAREAMIKAIEDSVAPICTGLAGMLTPLAVADGGMQAFTTLDKKASLKDCADADSFRYELDKVYAEALGLVKEATKIEDVTEDIKVNDDPVSLKAKVKEYDAKCGMAKAYFTYVLTDAMGLASEARSKKYPEISRFLETTTVDKNVHRLCKKTSAPNPMTKRRIHT